MTNFEKWLDDLKNDNKDVPITCYLCPARKQCDEELKDSSEFSCTDVFQQWARKEVE